VNTLTIETFVLGPDETNCYLLSAGGEAVVIDAGVDPGRLAARIEEQGLALRGIYLTHLHIDHSGGVRELHDRFGAPVYASPNDEFLKEISLEAGGIRELASFVDFPYEPVGPGRRRVLDRPMVVLDTPGHTPGSLSYFFPSPGPSAGCVFCGDLIFMIAVGRTDLPRGSGPELIGSIRSRIFILPDDTRIYSGHGPMTTVAHEKKYNPHFMV
jgi:glyoxylase-like metal-dependent hydrolase (beta-lactamase superfamily II)